MDKYEYKVRADEIKSMVASKQYTEAMQIADTIDWHRVKSIMMLTIVSDIYKVNRRYEDSKEVLLLAYDRHPGGRTIVYSLCELSIKMEEYVQAWEYYKEFVQIAPKDTGRFILQYKIYEAQEVSIEERISVLEEFKKRDYREKWAYELAYLYHRIGLSTKCVEECDELVLWFGEGKYVLKAMELKMLHEPLNPVQQDKYDQLSGNKKPTSVHKVEDKNADDDREEFIEPDIDVHVKPMDMSKYNTINLQKELAASMKELLAEGEEEFSMEEPEEEEDDEVASAIVAPLLEETGNLPDVNHMELQLFKQEVQEVFFEEGKTEEFPAVEELEEIEDTYDGNEDMDEGETIEMSSKNGQSAEMEEVEKKLDEKPVVSTGINLKEINALKETPEQSEYERLLSQEYDGQISLVVPEEEKLEKQITGQMNIVDILAEWENTKKENQEKRLQDVKKRVSEQTGQLFSEFDEATKTDLLAKLEAASKLEEENRRLKETANALTEKVDSDETEVTENEEAVAEEMCEQAEKLKEEDVYPEETAELEKSDGAEINVETKEEQIGDAAAEKAEESENKEIEANAEKKVDSEEAQIEKIRTLSEEEEKLFGSILYSKKAKKQLIHALDIVSLAPYTGNIMITGEEGTKTLELAKNLLKDIQTMDSNFSGKVAKISAKVFNSKNPVKVFSALENGALIIEKAGALSADALSKILKALDQGSKGIIIIIEDTPKNIQKLICKNKNIENVFNARINVPQLNNDALVAHAKQYALEQEFSIDELGILALYTRIADMQTSDHVVNAEDVEEIMEDAIYSATRKSLSHFKDVLFGKRYDDEDMIVLREKDFINY